ncbi:ribonuclease HII [Candidatus Nomurabacteria bacterium RIFCSPLOWO2_12_FULL_46_14]|uniref:Ribonuclease HII n=1 Tax=Candidatus Nomurabacteria bacterium RIFCSPLOWO2_12_FULL_46_14 TaxID=1801797 RepID=A0A1F6YAH3_9BACT|nr:MAG: ribonuclease HII [Candidatus Nomurabacteria bacterium RIFCSPLOWO2_12_FULL_46_14]
MQFPDFKSESEYLAKGYKYVAGCDEAGRGPLAGPVVAAACVLDKNSIGKYRSKNKWYARVRDSKTITEEEREILLQKILPNCLAWGVGAVWPAEIDRLNIHHASLLAMRRAVAELMKNLPKKQGRIFLLVDGRFQIPELQMGQQSIIDGDALSLSIAAASIIAKAHRDAIMRRLDASFPQYGFARHKGYGTKEHTSAIHKFGICDLHRKSFIKN